MSKTIVTILFWVSVISIIIWIPMTTYINIVQDQEIEELRENIKNEVLNKVITDYHCHLTQEDYEAMELNDGTQR